MTNFLSFYLDLHFMLSWCNVNGILCGLFDVSVFFLGIGLNTDETVILAINSYRDSNFLGADK